MKPRNSLVAILAIAALLALSIGVTSAQGPIGTAFTYQGRLTDGGAPANGVYDFSFNLYNVPSGGSAIAAPNGKNDVSVTNGLFTVTLDFGTSAFTDQARYLDISVRPGASTGGYTTLSPRQSLTPTPNALYSTAPWATSGSSISFSQGNVGIGTTAPNAALSIVKSSAPEPSAQGFPVALKIGSPAGTIPFSFRQNAAESTTPTLAWFETSSGDLGYLSAATSTFILGALTGKNLGLNVNGNSRAMTLATSGNVGIGTSSPTAQLHVSGTDADLRLESTNNAVWTTTQYKTNASEWHTGVGGSSVSNDVKSKYYIFDNTASQFRMVLDTAGKVGIGVTSPTATLEVKGDSTNPILSALTSSGASALNLSKDGRLGLGTSNSPAKLAVKGIGGLGGSEVMTIDSSDGSTVFEVLDDGQVGIKLPSTGYGVATVCFESGGSMYYFTRCSSAAEYVPSINNGHGFPDTADIVSIVAGANNPYGDTHGPFTVQKSSTACDANLLGFIVNPKLGGNGPKLNDHYLPLAIYGYFPAKVTLENGAIKRGDPLTSSSKAGYAMKATGACKIIGYALEDANAEGQIQVFADLGENSAAHVVALQARMDKSETQNAQLKLQVEAMQKQNAALEERVLNLERIVSQGGAGAVGLNMNYLVVGGFAVLGFAWARRVRKEK